MRIILSLFIFLSFFNCLIQAQTHTQTIRGTVLDAQSESPLIGATIIIADKNPPVGTISNENGEFHLEAIAVGRVSIQISYVGYNSITLNNLLLVSGKELVLNIKMEESVKAMKEVVITSSKGKDKPINEMATISARSFSIAETERYAGSLGDPSRMAANFAGVMSVSDQRNDIIIRGNSPMGLLWRMDGIDIPNPNHFGALGTTGGPISMLNNNVLSNSDFFTGAFPAEYGNALAGAFDLKMRTGNNEKHEYVGQMGFNGFEAGAEGPFTKSSKSSYLINARYSFLDIMHAMGIDFGTGSAIPQYKDVTFKVDMPTKKAGRFSFFGIGGMSFIKMDDSQQGSYGFAGVNIKYGSDMGVTGFNHLYYFNSTTKIKTNLSVAGVRSTTHVDSLRRQLDNSIITYPFYNSTYTEMKYLLSSEISKKINSKNNASVGIIYNLYHLDFIDSVYRSKMKRFFITNQTNGNMSLIQAYSQWQHKFSSSLTLNTGIHFQYHDLNHSTAYEPRVGLKWLFTSKQSLSAAFGMHSQLQPHTVYFNQSWDSTKNVYTQSNRSLDFSKSLHYVIGYDYLLNENMRIKIESYYQQLYNIPVSRLHYQYSMLNAGDNFYIPHMDSMLNKGTGRNYGMEITVEKFLSKGYYFLVTTSLFQSKYKGYDEIERNTAFNGNFVLNALGGYEYKITQNSFLALDLKAIWAGGKRYLPIDVNATLHNSNRDIIYDWNNAYSRRYDDYFKLNVKLSFKLNGKKANQEWSIDIQNVTAHKNIFQETYDPLTNEIKREYQMGFFPTMFYRILF